MKNIIIYLTISCMSADGYVNNITDDNDSTGRSS